MFESDTNNECPYCKSRFHVALPTFESKDASIRIELIGITKSSMQISLLNDDGIATVKDFCPIRFCPMCGRRVSL